MNAFQSRFRLVHQNVFGRSIDGLVCDAEPQVRARVIPRDGADRLLGDEVLAGRFGVCEVDRAAAGLTAAGATVIGSNCGNGSERMVEIVRELAVLTGTPLAIQANAGIPHFQAGALVYPESPAVMAEHAATLADLEVAIIGGCCGTTPDHTRAMRHMLDQR